MKRNILFVLTIIISGLIFGCDVFINPRSNSFLEFTPVKLDFGDVSVGGSKDETLLLTNIGIANLEINEITLIAGAEFIILQGAVNISNPIMLNIGESHTVIIRFSPSAVAGFSDILRVASNTSQLDELEVSGRGIDAGWIKISPFPVVNLGPVVANQNNKTQTITCENLGSGNLTVADITLADDAGGQYVINELRDNVGAIISLPYTNIVILSSEKIEIDVVFAPINLGIQHGEIQLTHNSGNISNKIESIELYGSGVEPLGHYPYNAIFQNTNRRNFTFSINPAASTLTDRTIEIFIANRSAQSATGISIAITGAHSAEFTYANAPTDIPGNSNSSFEVIYNPSAIGIHSAVCEVNYINNGNNFSFEVNLLGRATGHLYSTYLNICLGFSGLPVPFGFPGNVTITNESTDDVVINNANAVTFPSGASNFIVTEIQDNGGSPVTVYPHTIASGEQITVVIDFTPSGSDPNNGMIEIAYQVGGNPAGPFEAALMGYSINVYEYEVFDWFFAPSGWSRTGDWQWGTPSSGGVGGPDDDNSPTPFFSDCYGTNLNGRYNSNMTYSNCYLQSKSFNLQGHQSMMMFYQWLNVEQDNDFAQIQVSIDGGQNWEIVQPLFPFYNSNNAYTGDISQGQWTPALINLLEYSNESDVRIRWALQSNGSVEECGWYIDDILILDLPVILPEALITAHEAFNVPADSDGISLSWVSLGGETYNVYVDTNNPPTNLVASNIVDSWCMTPALLPDTTYYFKIQAISGTSTTTSPVFSFHTSPFSFQGAGVLVNEMNTSTNSDTRFVEIYNPTANAIDISSWHLLTKDIGTSGGTSFGTDGVCIFSDGEFLAPGEVFTIGETGSTGGFTYDLTSGDLFWTNGESTIEVNLLNSWQHSIDYFIGNIEFMNLDFMNMNILVQLYVPGTKWFSSLPFQGLNSLCNFFRLNSLDNHVSGDWGSRDSSIMDPNTKNPGQ